MTIVCSEQGDITTSYVLEWLLYFERKFLRINSEEFLCISHTISNEKSTLRLGDYEVNEAIQKVWYRKGHFDIASYSLPSKISDSLKEAIFRHTAGEIKFLHESIYTFLEQIDNNLITSREKTFINKITTLRLAAKCGLDIPNTLITNNKEDLNTFFLLDNKICIAKAINNNFVFTDASGTGVQYNQTYTANEIKNLTNDIIFPVLLQNYIEKQYEIRSFVLNRKIYSMCIFSQSNTKTTVDFRNYDLEHFNRCVPYKLPLNIEQNALRLMDELQINSGSIDILLDKDNRYIFLEVNPIGQFGMVSEPCNYHLEKIIAENLC